MTKIKKNVKTFYIYGEGRVREEVGRSSFALGRKKKTRRVWFHQQSLLQRRRATVATLWAVTLIIIGQ